MNIEDILNNSSEDEVEDGDSSRLENLHWCSCQCFIIFENMELEDCCCCREYFNLLADKLQRIECIALNPENLFSSYQLSLFRAHISFHRIEILKAILKMKLIMNASLLHRYTFTSKIYNSTA